MNISSFDSNRKFSICSIYETSPEKNSNNPVPGEKRLITTMKIMETKLNGPELLSNSRLNKGTAFTEAERDAFALHGLLPPHIGSLEEQRTRRHNWLASLTAPIEKYRFMRDL